MGWFKEEIKDASQMDGLKYRTVGLAADVLMEMGMSVVQLPGGEIQPAMKSGLIDAAEFNNPTSDKDFGSARCFQALSPWLLPSITGILEYRLTRKKYESLPAELQAILSMLQRLKTQTSTGITQSVILKI